jgi:hypothetical protein
MSGTAEPVEAALPRRGSKEAVIRRLLAESILPPTDIPWKEFCERVRDECNGWIGMGLSASLRMASAIRRLNTL